MKRHRSHGKFIRRFWTQHSPDGRRRIQKLKAVLRYGLKCHGGDPVELAKTLGRCPNYVPNLNRRYNLKLRASRPRKKAA